MLSQVGGDDGVAGEESTDARRDGQWACGGVAVLYGKVEEVEALSL